MSRDYPVTCLCIDIRIPVQLSVHKRGLGMLAAFLLAAGTGFAQSPPTAQQPGNGVSPAVWQPGTPGGDSGPSGPPMQAPPPRAPTEVIPTTPAQPLTPPPDGGPPPSPLPAAPAAKTPPVAPSVLTSRQTPAASSAPDQKNPKALLWEYTLPGFSDKDYQVAVDGLFLDFERRTGHKLVPGAKRRAGLKVMTGIAGLTTPVGLVRAVINALEARGFKPEELFILDQSESKLRAAGILPPPGRDADDAFEGVPVIVMDRGRNYDLKWFYDSPLPAPDSLIQGVVRQNYAWKIQTNDRLSLLPVPLLVDVDFWINLPVGLDQPSLGVMGALVNASLLASSNTQRFLQSPETGAVAVAEIAAVPELVRGWVFSLLSLEHYQYIGGPLFNSLYTVSEPTLFLSANPVILDYLLYTRINAARVQQNLPTMDQPSFLEYARQLDLGEYDRRQIFLVRLPQ